MSNTAISSNIICGEEVLFAGCPVFMWHPYIAQGNNYDSVVGVSRGGLIPATIMAEYMNVRELRTIGVRSYQLNGI